MKKNVGERDKWLRLIIAFLLLLWVWFDNSLNQRTQIIILTVALIVALTSFFEYCPLYLPFHFSTRKKKFPTGQNED